MARIQAGHQDPRRPLFQQTFNNAGLMILVLLILIFLFLGSFSLLGLGH